MSDLQTDEESEEGDDGKTGITPNTAPQKKLLRAGFGSLIISPFPAPEIMQWMLENRPGLLDQIERDYTEEAQHRRTMEIRSHNTIRWSCGSTLLVTLVIAIFSNPWAGFSLAASAMVLAAVSFVYRAIQSPYRRSLEAKMAVMDASDSDQE